MSIKTLGVDLGKLSCHIIGQDQHGKVVEKRKILISKFAEYLANLPPCAVFFEACGGAHHWCRKTKMNSTMPKPFVKPRSGRRCALCMFAVKSNKPLAVY